MTNKIPQEIEDEELSKPKLIWKGSVGEAIKQGRMTQEQLDDWNMEDEEGEEYLEGFKAGQKQSEDAFKEMIEDLSNIEFMGVSGNQARKLIQEELLSKINSQHPRIKQTRGGELKSDEGLHSTEYGFPADTSFLGGYAELWDNPEDNRWDKEYNPDLLPETLKNKEEKQDENS